jgi:hypothetical protein
MGLLGFIGLGIGLWIFFAIFSRIQRRKALMEKYGDEELVNRLMRKEIWEGQTSEQLVDSLGDPQEKDTTAYKTKTKDTWKYQRMGRGQYRLRVIVENGSVVGWKQNAR